jgi:surface polysaccharide O-acyltransferase-like enzyme
VILLSGSQTKNVISRVLRALVLSLWLYSFLAWLYVVLRIVVSRVDLSTPFIDKIPFISIWVFGMMMFIVSFVAMFVYLAVWWRPLAEQHR